LLHIAFSFTQNKNLFESISLLTNWRHSEQHSGQSLKELLKKIWSSVSRHNNIASTGNSHFMHLHLSTVLYKPTTCTCTSWVSQNSCPVTPPASLNKDLVPKFKSFSFICCFNVFMLVYLFCFFLCSAHLFNMLVS
jgi:hypothetical protein